MSRSAESLNSKGITGFRFAQLPTENTLGMGIGDDDAIVTEDPYLLPGHTGCHPSTFMD